MIGSKRVLAVVLARSGSKGIPQKNMCVVGGMSLIARAGEVLKQTKTVDKAMISTDSEEYGREGLAHGLDFWFLRPKALSSDKAKAIDAMAHAVRQADRYYKMLFQIALVIEPTSPLREPGDIDGCVRLLSSREADSVVSVSTVDSKFHPRKLLTIRDGFLGFYRSDGKTLVSRQSIRNDFYFRNGVCYALTRKAIFEKNRIFTDKTLPYIIKRPIINIDESIELVMADLLLQCRHRKPRTGGKKEVDR